MSSHPPLLEALRVALAADPSLGPDELERAGAEVKAILDTASVGPRERERLRALLVDIIAESSRDRAAAIRTAAVLVSCVAEQATAVSLRELRDDPELLAPPRPLVDSIAYVARITLFAWEEKCGKSTFWRFVASALSTGRPCLGKRSDAMRILWIRTEEHVGDVLRAFLAFGADEDRVFVASLRTSDPVGSLRTLVSEYHPGLVVIDTLTKVFARQVENFDGASEWAHVMLDLRELADESDAAIVLLHHQAKGTGKYRNSTEIGAGVDVIVEGGFDDTDERRRILKYRGRYGAGTLGVRFTGKEYVLDRKGPMSISERVHQFIVENPEQSYRKVKAGVRGGTAGIREALADLERDGLITNLGIRENSRYVAVEAIPGFFNGGPSPNPHRTAERTTSGTASAEESSGTPETREELTKKAHLGSFDGFDGSGGPPVGGPKGPLPNLEKESAGSTTGEADLHQLFGEDLEYAEAEREAMSL